MMIIVTMVMIITKNINDATNDNDDHDSDNVK